ncbi:MAG: benzoyl-CoA-dihydrodiol lyase, partial [Gammaproteobacteria bacterium]|nr:benzoyl-CoA-dihydrodiol lyase [Gammaproteobacteria bacterium]
MRIDFQTSTAQYRHWSLDFNGETAYLTMDVDETGGLFEGYELKLNSYDLGVDIELYDALQRLRFEHPLVKTVVLRSAKDRVFCAGANIRMLAGSSHAHKVNFCKFTNETRNSMEQASLQSGLKFIAAVNGSCAGGGYELALACDFILLTDDGSSSVSLPEVPLLAVLPGTGGLTRVTDKRKLRRDRADMFCCIEEGIKGQKAVDWRLVDAVAVNSQFEQKLSEVVAEFATQSNRPDSATGIKLNPLQRDLAGDRVEYSCVTIEINRELRVATVTINAPQNEAPTSTTELSRQGDQCWSLRAARELDDAILHLRLNEPE